MYKNGQGLLSYINPSKETSNYCVTSY